MPPNSFAGSIGNCGKRFITTPVKLLGRIPQPKLVAAATDDGYLAHMNRVHADFRKHLEEPAGITRITPADETAVAYFSAEFGLHESLPIYSGGLGILAGDHLKSASELGVPLAAVGLLYRNGYFQQYPLRRWLAAGSLSGARFLQPRGRAVAICRQFRGEGPASIICRTTPSSAKVWRANVGRVPLYLLDTNLPEEFAVRS